MTLEDILKGYAVDIEKINRYIKHKGKLLKGNKNGDCPLLHLLIEHKEMDLAVKILKDNKNWKTKMANPNSLGPNGLTALVYAIQIQPGGHQEIIEALLDAGADPSDTHDGRSPLQWAVMLDQLGTVEKLEEFLDGEDTIESNLTELIYMACLFDSANVLKYLLESIHIEH